MENMSGKNIKKTETQESILEQASLDNKLKLLKGLDLSQAVVNVYVTKISTSNKEKRFISVKRLKVHNDAKASFKSYVTECVEGNDHICELRTINSSQDNRFFYVEKAATDFALMEEFVTSGNLEYVQEHRELNDFNSYVIQLVFGEPEQSVFAFRYISGAWSVNKTSGKYLGIETMKNEMVVTIDNDPRFQITSFIDFIQFKDDIFIADIRQFETAMNFHERLKEKKGEAISALCSSPAIATTAKDPMARVIGNDKHLMRQLASVHEKGYYKNEIWLSKLKSAAEEAGNWKVKFDDQGKIEFEESKEYVRELLTLLQNKRVKTVVDGLVFDVDGELIALDV